MSRPIIYGKYCLLERVSVGGMAEVFRARPFNQPGLRRFVAVKRILPNLADDDEFVSMFVDEAKIAVQLNHRNVCQIYELGRLNNSFYIVMEYIAGRNLLQLQNYFRSEKRIMSVTQAAFLTTRICDGLDYSHRKTGDDGRPLQIIHRDVSPQNILISFDGEVKVIDFGIARAATRNEQTQVGVLKGKFGYMSPEQVDGLEIDRRSDVFAVGVLLWEMLTARRLFHGESDYATLDLVRACEIEPPSARNKRVPPELDAIVMRALERDRDKRYQWASELAADLRGFLDPIKPPYTERTLSQWMIAAWREDHDAEQRKFDEFSRFVTTDDVIRHLEEEDVEELDEELLETDAGQEGEERTQIYQGTDSVEVLAASTPAPAGRPATRADDEFPVSVDLFADVPPARPERPSFEVAAVRFDERRRNRRFMIGAAVVAATVVAAAVGYPAWRRSQLPAPGRITIDVAPSPDLQVLIDGRPVVGNAPWVIDGLSPGIVYVELRRPGFETVLEPVEIGAGTAVVFERTMTPQATDARIALTLAEPDAQVYLDGALIGGQGPSRRFTAAAGETHVVEVYLPGHFVETYEVTPESGAEFVRSVDLRPVEGAVRVNPEPDGRVLIDGVERGSGDGETVVAGLDVRRPIALTVEPSTPGFRPLQQTVVFDTYYDVRLQPRLRRIGETTEEAVTEYAWLTTGTAATWMRVLIDGRDTGLVTPIEASVEVPGLAVRPGTRRVTFARAGRERTVEVVVTPGQAVHVDVPPER